MNKLTFNPSRLTFAREHRGFSIKILADKLGVSTKIISNYENNLSIPPENSMAAIAEALRYPLHFFSLGDLPSLESESISFRSLARMSAKVRKQANCTARMTLTIADWLEKKFKLPETALPDLSGLEPETAAAVLRREWAIGEASIKNMVHLVESKGVRVFSADQKTDDMDAFSFWYEGSAYILLNNRKSAERSRFDCAHELGHLVLHQHQSSRGKEIESDANRFASAFLMPDGSVRGYVPSWVTLQEIIDLKSIWIVSAAALIRRAKDLNIITEWQYRNLTIQLSKQGGMKTEPRPYPHKESSLILSKILNLLREDGLSKKSIAESLGQNLDDIDTLLFSHVVTLEGGDIAKKPPLSKNTDRSYLKVIK